MVPDNPDANKPVDEQTVESAPGDRPQPVWGQLDLRFEEASRMLDQRLAEVIRREDAVAKLQPELREALARAEEQRVDFERSRSELADVTEARRAVEERHDEVAQREAALAVEANEIERSLGEVAIQRSEIEQGRAEIARARRELDERHAEIERGQAGLAELAALRQLHETGLAELTQRETALASRESELLDREARVGQQELAVEQALARAEELRAASEHGAAEREAAEQLQVQMAAALLAIAERERLVGEHEAELERTFAERERLLRHREIALERPAAPAIDAPETNDLEERAKWLIDVVKAAAKEEAETIVKEAHEQAELIRARAQADRPPSPPAA
jgi:hypothetical protein